jgi:L-lysine exporter family protein LysE/ArgO
MNPSVFLAGMTMGLSLIVAIGAQNAFVLRQGLRNQHVFAVSLICSASDAVLIAAGVGGFGRVAAAAPWLVPAMRYGGAVFLAAYGAISLRSALRSRGALTGEGATETTSRASAALTCLAFTWLNPHVYLDTLALLGAVSTQFPGAQASFAAGATSASFVFFFSLGYGAKRLRSVFAAPAAWRALEAIIAAVMWTISFKLVAGA